MHKGFKLTKDADANRKSAEAKDVLPQADEA